METAFLITFAQTVRVIVDRSEPSDSDIETAFVKAQEVMSINGAPDCVDEIKKDMECPFGTFDEDTKS